MDQKQKKIIIICAIIASVLIGGGLIIWQIASQKPAEVITEEPKPKKKKISVPSNIIAIDQRPFIELIPFVKNGRNLKITLNELAIPVSDPVEYLLEYSVGETTAKNAAGRDIKVPETEIVTGIQGSMGDIEVDSFPSSIEIFLGSCSAGGACTHHAGLSTGTLVLTYPAAEPYATSQTYDYFEKGTENIQTADGIFTLDGISLAKAEDFLIINSAGLPQGLEATPLTQTDPQNVGGSILLAYQLAFSSIVPSGEVEVKITVPNNVNSPENAQIYVYDSVQKNWSQLETAQNKEGEFTALDDQIHQIYVLATAT